MTSQREKQKEWRAYYDEVRDVIGELAEEFDYTEVEEPNISRFGTRYVRLTPNGSSRRVLRIRIGDHPPKYRYLRRGRVFFSFHGELHNLEADKEALREQMNVL